MLDKNLLSPVLLIEDSPDDVEFARRTFGRCAPGRALVVAEDGDAALALLTGEGERAPLRPALALLDLNLPGLAGRDVLARIRENAETKTMPVVMLTTSTRLADIEACYELGANSYHQKPTNFRAYEQTIERIAEYWLGTSILPPATRAARTKP